MVWNIQSPHPRFTLMLWSKIKLYTCGVLKIFSISNVYLKYKYLEESRGSKYIFKLSPFLFLQMYISTNTRFFCVPKFIGDGLNSSLNWIICISRALSQPSLILMLFLDSILWNLRWCILPVVLEVIYDFGKQ